MTQTLQISIEIPDTLDAKRMRDILSDGCAKTVRGILADIEKDKLLADALETDEGLARFMNKTWYREPPPYVRASTYKNRPSSRQEVRDFWCSRFQSDPRRPVWMRGSVGMLQGKYTIKSGYAEDVVDRYLRRIRFTSIDRAEIADTIDKAIRRACRLYEHHRHYGCNYSVYIDGERKHLNEEELGKLKKLNAMAKKVEDLESRMTKGTKHATRLRSA